MPATTQWRLRYVKRGPCVSTPQREEAGLDPDGIQVFRVRPVLPLLQLRSSLRHYFGRNFI
jgi:hypothetical protein